MEAWYSNVLRRCPRWYNMALLTPRHLTQEERQEYTKRLQEITTEIDQKEGEIDSLLEEGQSIELILYEDLQRKSQG